MKRAVAASLEVTSPGMEGRSVGEELNDPSLAPEMPIDGNRDLTNLDFLRTVAVLLVFTGHLSGGMRIRGLGDLGHFGVLLFFVHTSLVLMLSMGRLGLQGGALYTSFMVRRIFRIYPLSILTVLLVVSFQVPSTPWLPGQAAAYSWHGWPGLFSNILLIQNATRSGSVLCVLWSLPYEVQMYAALPLLYFLMRRFPSPRAAVFAWISGVAMAGVEYFSRSANFDSDFLLLRYFPCFLAGVLAWRLMETRRRLLPA